MADLDKLVPLEGDIPIILQNISKAAYDTMVKIFQMRPSREDKEAMLETASGKYYRIPISIDAKASYHQFGKFLNTLENSDIFMNVSSLEIIPSSRDQRRHNIRLVINTFIFKKQ